MAPTEVSETNSRVRAKYTKKIDRKKSAQDTKVDARWEIKQRAQFNLQKSKKIGREFTHRYVSGVDPIIMHSTGIPASDRTPGPLMPEFATFDLNPGFGRLNRRPCFCVSLLVSRYLTIYLIPYIL